ITFGGGGGLDFDFAARNLPGDALALPYGLNASAVRLGRLAADVQVTGTFSRFQTAIQWRAPEATYAGQGVILIAGDQIRVQDTNLRVAGGTVTAEATSIAGQWQALVQASGVRMSQLSAGFQGLLSGRVRLSGSLANLSPRAIRAEGEALLSEGVPQLPRSLSTSFRWLGDRLELDSTARGFSAQGYVLAQVEGTPAITGLNLDVRLQDYALNTLPVALPPQLQLAGAADFSGQVRGTPTAPAVTGQLRLNQLMVNDLTFERRLAGNVRYAGGQGLDVNLTGQRDRIAVRLDGQNRPLSFYVQQGDAIAQGQGDGQRLVAQLENFPLEALNIAPAAEQGLGRIAGLANGTFDVNLADLSNPSVVGQVAIARPALGYIDGDRFVGRISYANGRGTLSSGEFTIGNSLYRLAGSFSPGPTPQVVGRINIERGKVEDILTALQWFDLPDFQRGIGTPVYNSASQLDLIGVNVMGATILNQLRRYAEIVALHNQQRRDRLQAQILPELSTLTGDFSGDIEISNSAQNGFSLNFNIAGSNWNWDTAYRVEDVVAIGSLENGVLTLFPVRLQTGDRFLAFSGQVGGDQQSGQLQVQNVPIEPIRDLINLPVDLTGDLNATATLAGSIRNPQVLGELSTAGAALNDAPVQEARMLFGYNNARLDFSGRVVVNEPEPLQITGSIPYAFQFMDTDPIQPGVNLLPGINISDNISLDINVRNEGLGLLNIVTRQFVAWESGEGAVDLQVSGTLTNPVATGTAQFSNARFSSQILPEPLTDITGQVNFNVDEIQVANLSGRFSNGQVAVQGTLPISPTETPSQAAIDTPLTINLDGLNLDYKLPSRQDLYDGAVNGQVVIRGAALAPRVGGEVILSNGRVFIPDAAPVVVPGTTTEEPPAANELFTPPQFDNLRITLGDNLLVTKVPILNFVVTGALDINGSLDDLRPDGTVALRSGQLNIYTTTFSLARGHDSRAIFTPQNGLVPYIDVRLITSVPEVSRNSFDAAPPFAANEVADRPITDFGSLQTVRVQASVQGLATEIFQNLELTSSPRRSENEIIGLLGGGFVDTLGQGNGVLAIANLASSALLTNIQTFVSNALGLSEFRLFPTTISSEDDRTSSFGVAAELGVDITRDISVSALQILTDDAVPTQFNLRYRLSDEFLLRGSTNLSGDNRAVLEFETRF
ncbi:MAG TPA: translocation/assembly module TamB domain-containing protein, partial [Chroococcidiopsis sp.]